MRLFEFLLVLADSLGLLVLLIPQHRSRLWLRFASLSAPLLALVQALLEGPRWQMAPADAFAIVLVAIWLRTLYQPAKGRVHRALVMLSAALAIVLLVVAWALPIALPVFNFSKPTGPYALGSVTYHWTDSRRGELFTQDPNDVRELMAQVWYPSLAEPDAPRAPYIQDADAITPYMAQVLRVPAFLLSHFRYVTTHAVAGATIVPAPPTFPVLIYLTGLGGGRQLSMFQIEALVAQGYIVVGLDQPGAAAAVRFPDGRLIPGWGRSLNPLIDQSGAPQTPTPTLYGQSMPDGIIPYFSQDVSFVLDQLGQLNESDPQHLLSGHLDLAHVGLFGISLGAIIGSQSCAQDVRLKACLLMDAFVTADALRTGLQQPTLWITRPAETMRLERQQSGGWSENDIAITLDTMRAAYKTLPAEGYYVEMPTMFHVNFTDAPYFSPLLAPFGLIGPIPFQRGFAIVNAYSVAFFDKELKGKASSILEGQAFPEAHLERRQP